MDVEFSMFQGQYVPASPAHSLHSLSGVTSHLDHDVMMSPSQPDLGAVSGQASLLSLHGSGVAGGPPSQLSAGAHAVAGPLLVEEVQSLHALCKCVECCV